MAKSKHDKIILDLKNRVQKNLEDIVLNNYEYDLDYFTHGEIDCAYVNKDRNYAYVFEVKTNNSLGAHRKARYQLLRDIYFVKYEYDIDNIWAFYTHSKLNKYTVNDIHLEFHYRSGSLYDFCNYRIIELPDEFHKQFMHRLADRV